MPWKAQAKIFNTNLQFDDEALEQDLNDWLGLIAKTYPAGVALNNIRCTRMHNGRLMFLYEVNDDASTEAT